MRLGLLERLLRKVVIGEPSDHRPDLGPCWLWTGATAKGHGHMWRNGRLEYVHRISYELHTGEPIPDGLQLDHLCRVRNCLRPTHVEPVTGAENTRRGNAGKHSNRPNALKTHCPQGHEYTPENTYTCRRGMRSCIRCNRLRNLKANRKEKICSA